MKITKLIKKQDTATVSKITNNTLEEQRRAVLNNGKKFKYPVQYTKNKLIVNTIIITIIMLIMASIILWHQLYKVQNTGSLIYRITTYLPLPVANIDGENALYSDYLAEYRSNMILSESKKGLIEDSSDEKTRSLLFKKQSMTNAINNAYARKIAREMNITVSNEEIEEAFAELRKVQNSDISESAFNKIINDNYGLSPSEYRRMFIELPLIRQKVAAAIDQSANELKDRIVEFLKKNNNDFTKAASEFKDIEVGESGAVKRTNIDSGRTKVAYGLEKDQVSEPFISKGGDGYYIVKLLSKNDDSLSYSYIKINFTEFDKRIGELRDKSKIKEYIHIEQ